MRGTSGVIRPTDGGTIVGKSGERTWLDLSNFGREGAPGDAAVLSGRLTDPDGEPIAGTRIAVTDAADRSLTPWTQSDHARFATTDGAGVWSARVQAGHVCDVTVLEPGSDPVQTFDIDLRQAPSREVSIRLAPQLAVAGRVVNAHGRPVAGAHVTLASTDFRCIDRTESTYGLRIASVTGRFLFTTDDRTGAVHRVTAHVHAGDDEVSSAPTRAVVGEPVYVVIETK